MESDAKTTRLDCGSDRLSNLPHNLIDLIVERLPIHNAARTSILSKTWRNVWKMHPHLVFDEQFFQQLLSKKDTQTLDNEVLRIISNILLVHCGPILVFHLLIPRDLPLVVETDFWIKSISENGVQKLELLNRNQVAYKMPSYFFSCSELSDLSLTHCILDPPHGFGGFNNLLNVHLVSVKITAAMSFGTKLKQLRLNHCTGIEHLGHLFNYNNNLSKMQIYYSEDFDCRLLKCMQKVYLLALKGVTNSRKNIINLDTLVASIPRIRYLLLDVCFLESFVPDAAVLKRPTKLERLNLVCVDLYNSVHIQSTLYLMRSSPRLHELIIRLEPKVNSSDDMDISNSMVLPVDMLLEKIETVEILGMVGSKVEFLFVKLLLRSTPSLRWIKLKKNITVDDPKEELRISRDLLLIPRASTSSQIIWA